MQLGRSLNKVCPSRFPAIRTSGAYLARMAGCIACHTNTKDAGAPLAGGLALKTKFGTFYSPNLTTDKEHGIGSWTVDDFSRAVRLGVSPDDEPYYPAFPYPFYSKLSDQDIADLWAAFSDCASSCDTIEIARDGVSLQLPTWIESVAGALC